MASVNDIIYREHKKISEELGAKRVLPVDESGNQVDLATSAKQQETISQLEALNSLVPSTYDYISLSYTDGELTQVVFKIGGSGGTVVSTITLGYAGGNLTSVTKT